MKSYKHIILIGMPGSGKSSIAHRLAESLSVDYEDTDRQIEHTQKMSISQIFAQKGEETFRDMETEVLCSMLKADMSHKKKDLSLETNTNLSTSISHPLSVIATGGGSILRTENRQVICDGNLVVYLKLSIESLMNNLDKSSHRPLLESSINEDAENSRKENIKGQDEHSKRNKIAKLLAQRGDLYEESADIIIEADGLSFAEIVEKIIGQIKIIKRL